MLDDHLPAEAFHARAVAETSADLVSLTARLRADRRVVGRAMADFLDAFGAGVVAKGSQGSVRGMVALPMLVHGAEGADPFAARPAAVIHLLWWAAARYLDDLADLEPDPTAPLWQATEVKRGILNATAVGSHLGVELLGTLDIPDAVRAELGAEISMCSLDAIDGQLRDLTETPGSATAAAVLSTYRAKTGAPYGMAAALAARLAGCGEERVAAWRAFGRSFGLLRQIVNDQRDLVSGRHEDLRNGTATYLLAHFLESVPEQRRAATLDLLDAARDSPAARAQLADRLQDGDTIRGYAESLGPLIRATHTMLDSLGGQRPYVDGLHALVDETVGFFPAFRLAAA